MKPKSILIEERQEDPKSKFMLVLYMLFMSSYGYNVLYVQPIARSMKKGFDVKDSDLSILLTLGSVSTAVFFLPLIWIVVMRGVKFACIVGLILLTGGTILEMFIDKNFDLIYVGHFITHAGSPVFNIANAKFCSIWFGPKNRPLAITVNSMTLSAGIMLAFIVPGFFVTDPTGKTPEEIRSQVFNFHVYLAAMYGTLLILCILFFKESPENYVTYKEEEAKVRKNFNIFKQILELSKEPTYILFISVIGIGVSTITINQLLIVQMMSPYHFSQQECQIGGAIIIVSGLISSIGYSKLFIQLPNQLGKLKTLYMCIIVTYTLFSYLPSLKNIYALYGACFLLGFVSMIQVSISLESLIKYIIITGPQRIVVGSGLVQVMISLTNAVLSFSLKDYLMEGTPEGTHKINITVVSVLFFVFLLTVVLQFSFDKRIHAMVSKQKEPALLPMVEAEERIEVAKDPYVRSLSVLQ